MEKKYYFIEPQLITIYKNSNYEEFYLLTVIENYKNSYAYQKFLKISKKNSKLNIIKSHILLTLNIYNIKIFLNTLLNINYEYVLYSDEANIEYFSNVGIFNPFDNVLNYYENKEAIFENYINASLGIFLIILPYSEVSNNFPKYKIEKNLNLIEFVNTLFKEEFDFDLEIDYQKDYFYYFSLTEFECLEIINNFKYKNYKILYIDTTDEQVFIKGTYLQYIDIKSLKFSASTKYLIIFNDENQKILISDLNKLFCEDLELLKYIMNLINNYNLDNITNKILYKITFNIFINYKFLINENFQYIIKNTNSKNVYKLENNKILIFISKNKIFVKMEFNYSNFVQYLILLILYYNITYFPIQKKLILNKKIGINYLSRICQSINNKIRKPFKYEYDEKFLKNLDKKSDFFYNNDNTEIFINNNNFSNINFIYMCDKDKNKGRKYLGFIEKFYILNQLCIPCCYLYDQKDSNIFNNCINNNLNNIVDVINPYIKSYNKILVKNNIGFLPNTIDQLINGKENILKTKNNRVVYAKDFYCVTYYNNEIYDDFYKISKFLEKNHFIILQNILFTPYINRFRIDLDYENLNIYILVQNVLNQLIKINKEEDNDKINIVYNITSLIKNKFERFIKDNKKKFNITKNNLVYNENGFYIDKKKFINNLETKYFICLPNIKNTYYEETLDFNINIENIEIEDVNLYFLNQKIDYFLINNLKN